MKVIVYREYGGPEVLCIEEVEKPVPKEGEVLVRMRASSVNAADCHLMRGEPKVMRMALGGLRRPGTSRIGKDVAGVVESAGTGASRFRVGDAVFGETSDEERGAFAEYFAIAEALLLPIPANFSFEEAAAVPMAAGTAMRALRSVKAGERVLIHGASGGVGIFAVQIARALGGQVTAVCSTRNVEMVRGLGAERVVDYTREDFAQSGETFDLIVGVNGYRPLRDYRRALQPGGRYLMCGGTNRQIFEAVLLGPFHKMGSGKSFGIVSPQPSVEDLACTSQMIEQKQVRPVIDRTYPLEQVADAIRYIEQEHARGKVVITMRDGDA